MSAIPPDPPHGVDCDGRICPGVCVNAVAEGFDCMSLGCVDIGVGIQHHPMCGWTQAQVDEAEPPLSPEEEERAVVELQAHARERSGDSYGASAVLDRALYRETPPQRPWCAAEGVCACFGTVAPSTALRAAGGPLSHHCGHFREDGGTTPTLRSMR